jgi:hypothetical protein
MEREETVQKSKTRLVFKGSEVRKLIDDSKNATERTIPYVGPNKDVPVGLILVKDDGVYLISNAVTEKPPSETGLIAFAKGLNAPSKLDRLDARSEQYDKIRRAVGGDDFAEAVNLNPSTEQLIVDGMDFIVYLTADQITIQIREAA